MKLETVSSFLTAATIELLYLMETERFWTVYVYEILVTDIWFGFVNTLNFIIS